MKREIVPYPCLSITSGAMYSGVPNTCLSLNCLQSLSTAPSYKLVVTGMKKKIKHEMYLHLGCIYYLVYANMYNNYNLHLAEATRVIFCGPNLI